MRYRELLESQDYDAMFNPIESALRKISPEQTDHLGHEFNQAVQWARRFLKRSDRIHWYLRLFRIGALLYLKERWKKGASVSSFENGIRTHDHPSLDNLQTLLQKLLTQYEQQFGFKTNDYSFQTQCQSIFNGANRSLFAHFVSMEDQSPDLKSYKFIAQAPLALINDLTRLENEWKNKQDLSGVHQGEDTTFIQFPNGWRWVFLDRATCEAEGEAMGHCGNTANPDDDDRILSLREPLRSKQSIKWKPHATFIINNGILGEMKGRFNKKPEPDLHPYIIALLKNPEVRKVCGGGHDSANNFSFEDLTPEQKAEVMTANPALIIDEEEEDECEANGHEWMTIRGGLGCRNCDEEFETEGTSDSCPYETHHSFHDGFCQYCGYEGEEEEEPKS